MEGRRRDYKWQLEVKEAEKRKSTQKNKRSKKQKKGGVKLSEKRIEDRTNTLFFTIKWGGQKGLRIQLMEVLRFLRKVNVVSASFPSGGLKKGGTPSARLSGVCTMQTEPGGIHRFGNPHPDRCWSCGRGDPHCEENEFRELCIERQRKSKATKEANNKGNKATIRRAGRHLQEPGKVGLGQKGPSPKEE